MMVKASGWLLVFMHAAFSVEFHRLCGRTFRGTAKHTRNLAQIFQHHEGPTTFSFTTGVSLLNAASLANRQIDSTHFQVFDLSWRGTELFLCDEQ